MKELDWKRPVGTLAVLLVLAASFWVADGWSESTTDVVLNEAPAPSSETAAAETALTESDAIAAALNETFVGLSDRVTPGVVRIEVQRETRSVSGGTPQLQMPEPFRRFFEMPDPERQPTPRIGGGTGFIVSEDGYIVTNNHVVEDAERITVWLSTRRSHEAELVGTDPTTDIAVVRIDADELPALTWGSSDALRVGEWVVAIGNPGVGGSGPLDYTVTSGIVSAKNRPLQLIGQSLARDPDFGADLSGYAIENFIQTDAVINPGNSGGPLVNLEGEIVGVNTAIASTSGYYQGYGFAVPADLAERVVVDLIEDGTVERAWLGVTVTGVTAEDAEVYELPGVYGALVQNVTEDGPAEDARLRSGDVIVSVDGEPVERSASLQQHIAEHRPGQKVTVGVYRDGRLREFEVELGEAPISRGASEETPDRSRPAALDRLGMEVRDLTPELARELGYDRAVGVIVSDLQPLGPAARRGVARGLRLLQVNGERVETARDMESALNEVDRGAVVSLVLEDPDGQSRIVNLRSR